MIMAAVFCVHDWYSSPLSKYPSFDYFLCLVFFYDIDFFIIILRKFNKLISDWLLGYGYGTRASRIKDSTCRKVSTLSSTPKRGMRIMLCHFEEVVILIMKYLQLWCIIQDFWHCYFLQHYPLVNLILGNIDVVLYFGFQLGSLRSYFCDIVLPHCLAYMFHTVKFFKPTQYHVIDYNE